MAIVLIGDSIPSGTPSTRTDDRHRVAYLITQATGVQVYDMCEAGTFITRRAGFPKTALSGGLRDKFIVLKDYIADTVVLMQGHNDLSNGVEINKIIKEVRFTATKVMAETHIPKTFVICGLLTSTDADERPNVPTLNTALQTLTNQLHADFVANKYQSDCKYINGALLSDCNVPANMADGIHRSDIGRAEIATNLVSQLTSIGEW